MFFIAFHLLFTPPNCQSIRPEQPIIEYVLTQFNANGLNGDKAVAIILCESNASTTATNYNRNKTWDKGLWQINDINGVSDDCRFDLVCSTKWAIKKVKHDKGFSAWICERILQQIKNH